MKRISSFIYISLLLPDVVGDNAISLGMEYSNDVNTTNKLNSEDGQFMAIESCCDNIYLSMRKSLYAIMILSYCVLLSCETKLSCHEEMKAILAEVTKKSKKSKNDFSIEWKIAYTDSLLRLKDSTPDQILSCKFLKANISMEAGLEEQAINLLKEVIAGASETQADRARKAMAIAYMRLGERTNCITNHASESCILPVRGAGVHRDPTPSRTAIEILRALVDKNPGDLESAWLLNLAYMTIGDYPHAVPANMLIPGIGGDAAEKVNAFEDIAGNLGLDIVDRAGGSIVDDFDNDGYLDIITSAWSLDEPMHVFRNLANGTYEDVTATSGLFGITGGLNLMQADYNNDGFKDILVLRGAWKGEAGREPNSLLRNNGDGTFTDVTTESGILSFHPTQTATWNDFNNDGWLDLFIGNETDTRSTEAFHPCELYMNNGDGTFREVAEAAKVNIKAFVKGVTSGDYDNDGWKDIFISAMDGKRMLLRNTGSSAGEVEFEDVTRKAGLAYDRGRSFPTWFWDYDNDGWLDIFVCGYSFDRSLAYFAAAEKLNFKTGNESRMFLYHNNHDGTFTNVAKNTGLDKMAFAMGSNFGDIDNDGFLDMYLGTGNPLYSSIIPNKMFRNIGGRKFADVTTSARVGHLQKGHGVSFADIDNDGDQDIHIEMGGAYLGDAYQNSLFLNPGQGNNRWICLELVGTESNWSAIGSRVRLTFKENGELRQVYRDVNSGGSFGASPLRREIGVGQADLIDEIEIRWHGSGKVQTFTNVTPNQFLRIVEGKNTIEPVPLKTLDWILPDRFCEPLSMDRSQPAVQIF